MIWHTGLLDKKGSLESCISEQTVVGNIKMFLSRKCGDMFNSLFSKKAPQFLTLSTAQSLMNIQFIKLPLFSSHFMSVLEKAHIVLDSDS